MTAPTLTEFLLARIAEDEAVAGSSVNIAGRDRWWVDGPAIQSGKYWVYSTGEKFADRAIADHIARHDPARVLAECEAKRRIVDGLREAQCEADGGDASGQIAAFAFMLAIRSLAAVYADHPDYDEAWRL